MISIAGTFNAPLVPTKLGPFGTAKAGPWCSSEVEGYPDMNKVLTSTPECHKQVSKQTHTCLDALI